MPEGAMSLEQLATLFDELAKLRSAEGGIGVADEQAARVAHVLEFGSIVGQRPWPQPGARTVLAVDPETGAHVVVSAQAPQGFIRIQVPNFLERLRDELAQPADWLEADELQARLEEAVRRTTQEVLEQVRATAPRDSGRLRESLQARAG
jgi:hypothetical protein